MADMAKTFFGGILRASATALASSYTASVQQSQSMDQRFVIQDVTGNTDDVSCSGLENVFNCECN